MDFIISEKFGNNHKLTRQYSGPILMSSYVDIEIGSQIMTTGTNKRPCSGPSDEQRVFPLTSAGSSSSFALLFVLLSASTPAALRHHLLLHHVDDLVWDSQVLDGASSDVALRHPPKLISILLRVEWEVSMHPNHDATSFSLHLFSLEKIFILGCIGFYCTVLMGVIAIFFSFLCPLCNYLQAKKT